VSETDDITLRDQLSALYDVAIYRPLVTVGVVTLSIFAALLEGVGLSFLIPIIEIAQGNADRSEMSGVGETFTTVYDALGVPFTLEYVVAGVGLVMVVRYSSSFVVAWLKAALKTDYVRHLQTEGFKQALQAEIAYYDEHGSDEILNAIVTQAEYAGTVIKNIVMLVEQGAISLIYVSIALYIAPVMTILTAFLLGIVLLAMRFAVESGYAVGDRIADANEQLHRSAQAGTQGIRDVKLFGLSEETFESFVSAAEKYYHSSVLKARNEAAMDNIYQMVTAIAVFVLIYLALTFAALSIASLGVFLFAMFRLAPRVSTLNNLTYQTAGNLPHLVRTQRFIDELSSQREEDTGDQEPPSPVENIQFSDVSFSYGEECVLNDVSFEAERGELVAFVGPSGAGKSTIVSLLSRLYDPDTGEITANGVPIEEFELADWRERVSMVRQDPHMFNDTLRYNVTVGNRSATESEIEQVCELSQVSEFLGDLPRGLDTVLGDNGVRLSGGQRQRVALARALLEDSDVVVLDEATSDLDTALEERIQSKLESSSDDRILITIAHRLSTVVNADRIYAMRDGVIVEQGTHQELLDESGTYAELYLSQAQ
jgi:subfamily B ATP-binding cassette protein MsbA